ncbi:MAG: glycosyltransferase [Desulfuromonadales bacterium]|nr:glycosyltransferase [Desulfuromonadales bacterium]
MRLLMLVPDQDRATGNWVTARRLTAGLNRQGHACLLHGVTAGEPPDLAGILSDFRPAAVLLLHAWRSGLPWLQAGPPPLPMLVLLTGTDLNQGLDSPEQAPVINEILARAAAVLLQNRCLLSALAARRPDLQEKLVYLPPGVALGNEPYDLRRELGLPAGRRLLLCPASIRPVKGVVELLELAAALAARRDDFHLVFCGPLLADDYARRFLEAVALRPWASYVGTIPHAAMAAAIGAADLVLNSSFHEGLPNSLLEADALGVPILARDIPGNAEAVRSGENGLLYTDVASFVAGAGQLLDDPSWRTRRPTTTAESGSAREIERLDALLRSLVS